MNTIIITDSNCDLPEEYLRENNIPVIPFHFNLNGEDYEDNFGKSISYKNFYDELRKGAMSTTSQISPYTYEEYFRKYVNKGCSIIYIAFSSALSESYNHSLLARENVLQEFPSADITVIDSKAASVGQGILVQKTVDMFKDGKTNKEIIIWLESNKMKVNQWFTVDSLDYLKRGGRLSATSAYLGTMMNVKPVLIVDKDGKLSPVKKVRGRKKAISELFNELKNTATNINEETVYISHADCLEDAQYLQDLINNELTVKEVVINNLGPIIGTHTGPGLLCLAFMGQERA
jgi:DegV family protein with EDD domain